MLISTKKKIYKHKISHWSGLSLAWGENNINQNTFTESQTKTTVGVGIPWLEQPRQRLLLSPQFRV